VLAYLAWEDLRNEVGKRKLKLPANSLNGDPDADGGFRTNWSWC
jgi:hypothetical protein